MNNIEIMELQSKKGWGFFEIENASQEFIETVAVTVEALTGEQTATVRAGRMYLYVRAPKKWANGLIMVITRMGGPEAISEADSGRIKKALEILIKNKA
jgi:hypothetical protein